MEPISGIINGAENLCPDMSKTLGKNPALNDSAK